MRPAHDELRVVRILEFPVDVNQRASEAFEGLRREFTLVAMRSTVAPDVPARLLELVDALTDEFEGISAGPDRVRAEAEERGDTTIPELIHNVPSTVVPACIALNDMIDEADEYCRQGDFLLSLASSPEAVVFRRWYLGEFTAQLLGEPPLPWPEVDQGALLGDPRLRGTSAV